MSKILVVCDVQKEFMFCVDQGIFNNIKDFVTKTQWDEILVVVDTNTGEASIPDWLNDFSTTILTKRYGYWLGEDDMTANTDEYQSNEDGTFLELESNDLYIPVTDCHEWFALPAEWREFFLPYKGKQVTLIGGAEGECLADVCDALTYLGIHSEEDLDCIYGGYFRNKDTEWYEYDTNWIKVY